jgi:hypothetical protein
MRQSTNGLVYQVRGFGGIIAGTVYIVFPCRPTLETRRKRNYRRSLYIYTPRERSKCESA